jgi:hypothetical protein
LAVDVSESVALVASIAAAVVVVVVVFVMRHRSFPDVFLVARYS